MTSDHKPQSIADAATAVKEIRPVICSVRIPDCRVEKLIRKAALERNITRSEFMALASERLAREDMRLQREADYQAYLDAA